MKNTNSIISMHEAKSTLSQLVKRAEQGEMIMIGAYGKPSVKLVAIEAVPTPKRIGVLADKLNVPDDFDAPLPDDVLALFEGS